MSIENLRDAWRAARAEDHRTWQAYRDAVSRNWGSEAERDAWRAAIKAHIAAAERYWQARRAVQS